MSLHVPDPSFPLEKLNLGSVSNEICRGWGGDVPRLRHALQPRYMFEKNPQPATAAELAKEFACTDKALFTALIQTYAIRICFCLIHEKLSALTQEFVVNFPATMATAKMGRDEPIQTPQGPDEISQFYEKFVLKLDDPKDIEILRHTDKIQRVQEVLQTADHIHRNDELHACILWMFRSGVIRTLNLETHRVEGGKDLMNAFKKVQKFLSNDLRWAGAIGDYLLP